MPSASPPDVIDRLFDKLGSSIGNPPDQLKLLAAILSSLLLSLPFAYFPPAPPSPASASSAKPKKGPLAHLSLLPSPLSLAALLPHVYGVAISTFYLITLLKLHNGYTQLLLETLLCYALCGISLGISDAKGRIAGYKWPWIIFWIVMGHLTINHVYRYIAELPQNAVDHTPTQMVLTMKLTQFAWNLYDGQSYVNSPPLDKYQSTHAFSRMPSLIEFFGFAFFPAGTLIGPSFTFASYDKFVKKTVFMASEGKDEGKKGRKVIIPEGRFAVAGNRLLFGLINLGIFAVLGPKTRYQKMLEPEFQARSWGYKFCFLQVANYVARYKFYGVWKLAEAGFVISGMGWEPELRNWTASRNIQVRAVDLAQNFKAFLDCWNENTNIWLREAVYKRTVRPGKKPGFNSKMATFGTSALWHGPHPAYFLTFLLGGFYSNIGVDVRRNIRPFFLPPGTLAPRAPSPRSQNGSAGTEKKVDEPTVPLPPHVPPKPTQFYVVIKIIYDILGLIATQSAISFAIVPFQIISIKPVFAIWRTLGWYGLYTAFIPTILSAAGVSRQLKRRLEKREKRYYAKLEARSAKGAATADARKEVEAYRKKEEDAAVKSMNVAAVREL